MYVTGINDCMLAVPIMSVVVFRFLRYKMTVSQLMAPYHDRPIGYYQMTHEYIRLYDSELTWLNTNWLLSRSGDIVE